MSSKYKASGWPAGAAAAAGSPSPPSAAQPQAAQSSARLQRRQCLLRRLQLEVPLVVRCLCPGVPLHKRLQAQLPAPQLRQQLLPLLLRLTSRLLQPAA